MCVRRVQACCMQNLTHCGAKSCAPGPGAPQTQRDVPVRMRRMVERMRAEYHQLFAVAQTAKVLA